MKQKKKKGMSIRAKLIWVIIPIVLIIIISFSMLSSRVVLKGAKEMLQDKSRAYAGEISSWTNQIFGELQIYQDTINGGYFKDDAAILTYMESSVDKNPAYPIGLYMGDDGGVYLDASGWVPEGDWVLTERDWYVDGKDNAEFAFGEPYYDSMTGQVCVSASVLMDYDKATRVLATDVYLDYVSGIVADISAEGDADAFLVTGNSQTIIAHPSTEMMAVTLSADYTDPLYAHVSSMLSAGQREIGSVKAGGNTYYVSLYPIEHTDWYLVTYITERAMLTDMHWMEMYMVFIAIAATIILIVLVLRIMNRVVKPVAKMTDVIDKIAEGDFSQNLEVKGRDEIARMSNNMQMFISQMRGTIAEIQNTADWLNVQANDNEKVSDSLKTASENQAGAMAVLGQMVEQISGAAQEVSAQMEILADLIGETRQEGKSADALMKESVILSRSGKEDMENISNGMSSISTSITTLSEQISKVNEATTQIGDMVNMIMDIAEETNLLSLNASIEAARAGEAGRGFAVVAEQIGKLAANSSMAADDISRLTTEIQATVDLAALHMDTSVLEVKKSVEIVADASETFDGLYDKVDETSRRVDKMIELVDRVDDVAGTMEQTARSQVQATEQIVQSADTLNEHTKNVAADSNAVADSAQQLKKESMELAGRIDKFKV